MGVNEHGMPIYFEIHKGHRRGDLNFGVMTGLIEDFSFEEMREFREILCVAMGIAEDAFRSGSMKRNPPCAAEPGLRNRTS